MDNFEKNLSKMKSLAGQDSRIFVVLALLINGLLVFLLPSIIIPFGLKIFLFAAGAMIVWAAMSTWWQGVRGGYVTLVLPCDPVPLGVLITLNFSTSKAIATKSWTVEAKLDASRADYRIWSQTFQVAQIGDNALISEITFPCDEFKFTSIIEKVFNTVTLKADDLEWNFDIKTRIATNYEAALGLKNAQNIGANIPYYKPEVTKSWKWRWFKFVLGIAICVIGYQVISHYDSEARSRANTKVGGLMDSTKSLR